MTIILISSNGYGAGKTYLAELVGGVRAPLAYGVRRELTHMFPEFRHLIHSPSQEDKSFVLPSGKTVRQELLELGQLRCEDNKTNVASVYLRAGILPQPMETVQDGLQNMVE